MKKVKGISLIVLVITIIVIIILAGAVILSLSSNNPINQASEATFKETVKSYSSQLDLYNASQFATTLGAYNPELLQADSTSATYNGAVIPGKPNIYSIIPAINPTSADGSKFSIKKGKLSYNSADTSKLDWVEEVAIESPSRPLLILTPNTTDNYINLQWNINDTTQPYSYKVFQKKEDSTDFQTISAVNSKDKIKVLNVYPVLGTTYTSTNWKNETFTLPQSAQTKMWMETPNVDDPKGYGKGLIDVDAVELAVFNANPTTYMKNVDGSWKYDVIYEGAWDCNGACTTSGDNSVAAKTMLQEFIQSGRGVLMGHDTMYTGSHPQMSSLRNYFNLKLASGGGDFVDAAPGGSGTQIVTYKKGLLTNYPWNIGEIGTTLTIPSTHTSGQIAYGDVWMRFGITGIPFNGGESNFYLTTWNNTAMIQLGHSNGAATPDEQKILANTLFYLAQLTNLTYLDDHSGQDVKAPTDPVITQATINGATGKVDIAYSASQDLGSMYIYYIEAKGQNNGNTTQTGIKTTTITSGLAGYSIVVDTVTNTIPPNTVNATTLSTSIVKPVGTNIYVHIKAIDNKGNASNTVHLKAI
jgi:hypothetical protein